MWCDDKICDELFSLIAKKNKRMKMRKLLFTSNEPGSEDDNIKEKPVCGLLVVEVVLWN